MLVAAKLPSSKLKTTTSPTQRTIDSFFAFFHNPYSACRVQHPAASFTQLVVVLAVKKKG
jgi:hypothetical protein